MEEMTTTNEEATEKIDLTIDDPEDTSETVDLTNDDLSDTIEPAPKGNISPEPFVTMLSPDYNPNTPGYEYEFPPYSPYAEPYSEQCNEPCSEGAQDVDVSTS